MRFTPILAAFVFCLVKVQPSTSRVISVEVQKRAPSNFANEIGDAGVEKRIIWGYYFKDMGDGDVAKDIGDGGVEKHMEDGEVEKRTIFGYYFKDETAMWRRTLETLNWRSVGKSVPTNLSYPE